MNKEAIIGMVIVVVICIVGFMLYNWQQAQLRQQQRMDPAQQIGGGIGSIVSGIIGVAEGH